MLNCVYDCRYCFLQGMYQSAHYVIFVNYEGFMQAIVDKIRAAGGASAHFFSGYDCDSLALDPVTGFVKEFLPLFRDHPQALLELRTKSTQIRSLLDLEPIPNCIVAYSFTPAEIADAIEHKAPPVSKRLRALRRLQARGWRIGLRFDPLIYQDGVSEQYEPSIRRCCIRSAWGVSAFLKRITDPWRGCIRTRSCLHRRWKRPATAWSRTGTESVRTCCLFAGTPC